MATFEFQGLVLDPASMADAVWAIEHFGYLPNDFHYSVFQHPDLQEVLNMSSESTEEEWQAFKLVMEKLKEAYPLPAIPATIATAPILDGGVNKDNALRIAEQIWKGLCMGFGGHSQVPNTAYAEAIVGHVNNNCHTFNQDSSAIQEFMRTIAKHIDDFYDDQWGDVIYSEELINDQKELISEMENSISDWIESEVKKGNLKVKA